MNSTEREAWIAADTAAREAVLAEAAAEGFDPQRLLNLGYRDPKRLQAHLDLMRESRDYAPQVGDGMTMAYPQDYYPYVIVRVSPSGKTVWVKPLEEVSTKTGHSPARYDGPFPVWEHTYTDEERKSMIRNDAPEQKVTRSRDGLSWSLHGTPMLRGGAGYRRNYSY
jgi:hypothetical protein